TVRPEAIGAGHYGGPQSPTHLRQKADGEHSKEDPHALFPSEATGGIGHHSHRDADQANSRMTASTGRLSPTLAWIVFTTPSRSARRTFSIFMASTTARVSPALTSCPSVTAMESTSPGMGQRRALPESASLLSGISRAASASRSVNT